MKLYNIVKVYTSTVGTGTVTLGSAVPSFITFATAGVVNGSTVSYAIEDGNNREVGTGTYTSGAETLTRSVATSTNSNNLITLSGNAVVFITGLAADLSSDTANTASTLIQRDGSGNFAAGAATLSSVVINGSSSGSTTVQASAAASGTLTLPAATDTLIGKATSDTLTNKTFDTAGAGNVFRINGTGITAVTGSGSVVLDTSPTIATPTITTSATVPLVIGGTGTTSTLTLRSTSGVGTTGADIIFQTGNNGATEVMRLQNGGNVGIGTASPLTKLHVAGGTAVPVAELGGILITGNTSAKRMVMGVDSTSTMYSWIQSVENGVAAQSLSLNPLGGNVGIGTASPADLLNVRSDQNASTKIRITNASTGSSAYSILALQNSTDADAGILRMGSNNSSYSGANSIALYTVGAYPIGFVTNNLERMRILSTGEVGIGTSSPVAKTDIYYTSTAPSLSSQSGAALSLLGSSTLRIAFGSDPSSPFGGWIQSSNAAGTSFPLNLNPLGGNVGIGTASPEHLLDLYKASLPEMRIRDGVVTFQVYTDANSATLGTIGSYPIVFRTNTTERMRILSTGEVGIGTSSPSFLLDLYKASLPEMRINDGVTTFQCYVASGVVMGTVSNHPIVFRTNATERMRIDSSGNVGIGTSSPATSAKLEIAGTTGALLVPRLTTTERNALTAVNGMIIYNTTDNEMQGYINGAWAAM